MRWRIDVSYDGTDFRGWATQPGFRTVQGVLEEHISKVLRLPQRAALMAAGRTDAGVHAREQVCHLDLDGDQDVAPVLMHRLNKFLPKDIVILGVAPAPAGFDARFSAIWRRYCYRLLDSEHLPDPLQRHRIAEVRHPVDVDLFNEASEYLRGLRDFAAFCKPREGATTIRDLREVRAHRTGNGVVEVRLVADAFCHSMVRSVVGALTAVAGRRRSLDWLVAVSASPVRHHEILVMPAKGLTLEHVEYPADDELATRAEVSRSLRTLEDS